MKKQRPPQVHLNLNVRGMPNSATVSIEERCNALRAQGRTVYKLGLGQSPFPVPAPVVEALRENAHQKDYLPVRGLRVLRDAVAAYHVRAHGIGRDGEDVLIGPGSKELMFLLQLVYYGDLVIPTPAWVSYAPQAQMIGRRVHLLATRPERDWQLGVSDLERLCEEDTDRPRIVVLNYPSNPTGGTYRLEDLKQIARVARRHEIVFLSDEIYGELHHKGQHVSIARFYPEGTIVSSGLSKWCGAGGWRLGTFLFPPGMRWLLEAMASAASETYTATSAPIQYAAVRAFQGGEEIDAYLRRSRRVLGALGRWAARRLRESDLVCVQPAGAFYLFPDFGAYRERLATVGIYTSDGLCERLLQDTGVALLPGRVFGRDPGELTARLSYVDFDGGAALEAAAAFPREESIDEKWLGRYCAGVVAAVHAIREWLAALGA